MLYMVEVEDVLPLPATPFSLVRSALFPAALWLSGFGVSRSILRWCVFAVLIGYLGLAVFLTVLSFFMVDSLTVAFFAVLFVLLTATFPAALGAFLALKRPTTRLFALERFIKSRRKSSAT
jgi:hypothetical protein